MFSFVNQWATKRAQSPVSASFWISLADDRSQSKTKQNTFSLFFKIFSSQEAFLNSIVYAVREQKLFYVFKPKFDERNMPSIVQLYKCLFTPLYIYSAHENRMSDNVVFLLFLILPPILTGSPLCDACLKPKIKKKLTNFAQFLCWQNKHRLNVERDYSV